MNEKELSIELKKLTTIVRKKMGSVNALNFYIDHVQVIKEYFNKNNLYK